MLENWYYSDAENRQHGPMSREALAREYRDGALQPAQLVWREGMPEWKPAGEVLGDPRAGASAFPVIIADAPPAAPAQTLPYAMPQLEPLVVTDRSLEMFRQTKPWVRFISVLIWIMAAFMLLGGVFALVATVGAAAYSPAPGTASQMAFMLIYLPMALLYVMPAIYLGRYASRINDLLHLRRGDLLEQTLEAQKSFWKFCGIVSIAFLVLYIIMIGVFAIIAASR